MSTPSSPASSGESRVPFKRRGSILLTLIAVLTAVGLAPLASVAWKLIDLNREALSTAQLEFQLLLASSIAREFDTHVEGLQFELGRVARTLGATIGRRGPIHSDEVRAILDDVTDDRMLCLHFQDLQRDTVVAASTSMEGADIEPIFEEGFARAAESLAGSVDGRSNPAWISTPILLPGSPPRAALVLSSPVVSGGSFRGVLSAVVDLQSAWNAIAAGNRSGHTLFALDRTGRVFAASSPERIHPGEDMTGSPLVRRFRVAEGRATETLPFSRSVDGTQVDYIGSYLKTNQGWGIFVQAEQRQVYWSIRDMIHSTRSWALIAFALAILAAVLLARGLSKPIQTLATASHAFASGNFATRVQVGSRNEIGELAATFNLMAAEVEDHIRKLQQAAAENKELFMGTINALTAAIDAKDPYTRGHSERVNKYAVTIARYMGLPDDQIWEIDVASRLHDVGKIAIDDAVLRKPGRLSEDEMEHMKTHPVRGATIMASIRQMKNMIPGLRSHHERWAGGGYPDGLVGEAIPLMARIIAVADTFDATTTHRPYQTAMTLDQARARINEICGAVLDARVVEAFNRAFEAGALHAERAAESAEAPVTTAAGAAPARHPGRPWSALT